RWCKRNPSLAVASSLAIAALVAVAVISLVFAVEQTKVKNRIKGLANNLQSSLTKSESLAGELKTSLKESERRLAVLNFERGLNAFDKGEVGLGLCRLIESWRSAVEAGDLDWQRTARANLAAWQDRAPRLTGIVCSTEQISAITWVFSPDGRRVLTGGY